MKLPSSLTKLSFEFSMSSNVTENNIKQHMPKRMISIRVKVMSSSMVKLAMVQLGKKYGNSSFSTNQS